MASVTSYKQKYENKLAREKRERQKAEEMGAAAFGAGVGVAGAGVMTFLTTKFPRLSSLDDGGKVRTRWILGPLSLIGGLMADDEAGYSLMFLGSNLISHEVDRLISTWPFAQP